MRPKKKVLLHCPDPTERGQWAMRLDLWGYAGKRCGSEHHPCLECLQRERFDLLLLVLPPEQRDKPVPAPLEAMLLVQLAAQGPAGVLLLDRGDRGAWMLDGEPWFRHGGNPSEVRETIRLAVARKRGPKKGAPRREHPGPVARFASAGIEQAVAA